MKSGRTILRALRTVAAISAIILATFLVFQGHGKPLTAGLVDLVLVMLIAFRYGFVEAVTSALVSGACLDFFYMVPVYSLYERDPQDWLSSVIFVIIALTAGRFVTRIKEKEARTEIERRRLEKLYLTSRDIILLNSRESVLSQLANLIIGTFSVEFVGIWDARASRMETSGSGQLSGEEVKGIFFADRSSDDPSIRKFARVLRLGTRSIGSLCIIGPATGDLLDTRSVDAIASLSAIALERAHSFISESNAEAVARSEQMRSTVLDGLAHAFKTPLATIQSASSGLLEINRLSGSEAELVTIIDEQAARLARLTTQVLRTAKLDESDLRLEQERIEPEHLFQLLREELGNLPDGHTLVMEDVTGGIMTWGDVRLVRMAILQLLDNAIKYASPASTITLKVNASESEVIFSVANEGSFIAPEERVRIFDRFYRSPGSQYRAAGTGIGLAVTKRIIEAHRGRVWVESPTDDTTVFFLALPRIVREV
jgi:two-component system, OmpR family, sensor histidine kinase KdpD